MSARLRLQRADGSVYLDRWGFEFPTPRKGQPNRSRFGIFLHKMEAPDPGVDLHDHPWPFVSIILWGGYFEERAHLREASSLALLTDQWPKSYRRGTEVERRRFSAKVMHLDECHRITGLRRRTSWSLVIHGRNVRQWGFHLPSGWMQWREYELSEAGARRELSVPISSNSPDGSRP